MRVSRFIAAGAVLVTCGTAGAASFTVTKTTDTFDGRCDSDCSLREAIQAANASSGEDTIYLADATYTLSIPTHRRDPVPEGGEPRLDEDENAVGDLDIHTDLKIIGKGGTVIDANRIDRVLEVLGDTEVKIQDLAIVRGHAPEKGGGVYVGPDADLTLLRVRLADNWAQSASDNGFGQGGGAYNEGTLDVKHTRVEDNLANGGDANRGEGGGIYSTGRLLMVKSVVRNNRGYDESDTGGGGGVFNTGWARLNQSQFTGNTVSFHGHGGAILNLEGGELLLENVTVSGNESGPGGGSQPSAGGGAVANGTRSGEAPGTMRFNYVTVADNIGGGVFNAGAATYIASIIAGNHNRSAEGPNYHSGSNCENYGEEFGATSTSLLLGNDGNCTGDIVVENATVFDEVLYPLADNDGPTLRGIRNQTHAVRSTGPAVDASASTCPVSDQRGKRRPADGDGDGEAICDIGAFERQSSDPQ